MRRGACREMRAVALCAKRCNPPVTCRGRECSIVWVFDQTSPNRGSFHDPTSGLPRLPRDTKVLVEALQKLKLSLSAQDQPTIAAGFRWSPVRKNSGVSFGGLELLTSSSRAERRPSRAKVPGLNVLLRTFLPTPYVPLSLFTKSRGCGQEFAHPSTRPSRVGLDSGREKRLSFRIRRPT